MTKSTPLDAPVAYPIHVGVGITASLGELIAHAAPAYRYAIISDSTVAPLHASTVRTALERALRANAGQNSISATAASDAFEGSPSTAWKADEAASRVELFVMPAGESHKTRETWAMLSDALLSWGAGRDTTIIALGGGVVGDVAGFVAATYMRGVPVVQVPTTLLAMVDAAVGGKTGVDSAGGKNLIGAFHDPSLVVMAIELLDTLPADALRTGLAEIIKHGVIADADYFRGALAALPAIRLHGARAETFDLIAELVTGSIRIKAGVVAEDARESARRQILNFGHTIAHAIEHSTGYAVAHGDAVAIGMVAEARIAEAMGVAAPQTSKAISEALCAGGLPTALPASLTASVLVEATRSDKKNRAGVTRYALPAAIGRMDRNGGDWSRPVPDSFVHEILSRMMRE